MRRQLAELILVLATVWLTLHMAALGAAATGLFTLYDRQSFILSLFIAFVAEVLAVAYTVTTRR